jgi:hypothetical protein
LEWKKILNISNNAPEFMFSIGDNKIGIGGNAPFGKLSVNGQESSIGISLYNQGSGEGFLYKW